MLHYSPNGGGHCPVTMYQPCSYALAAMRTTAIQTILTATRSHNLRKRAALVTGPSGPAEAGMWLLLTLPHEASSCLGVWSRTGARVTGEGGKGGCGENNPLAPFWSPHYLSSESSGSGVFVIQWVLLQWKKCKGRNLFFACGSDYILSSLHRSLRPTKLCLNHVHSTQCTFYPLASGYL